jgi:hypothetical protein
VNTFKKIISDPVNMAWILTPVQSYKTGVQDIMETCLYKMREAIKKMPVTEAKDVAALMRVYEAFDKRAHGDYTQKIEKREHIRTENINSDASRLLKDAGIGVIEVKK